MFKKKKGKELVPVQTNIDPQSLIEKAINQKVPMEVLEKLLAMRMTLKKEGAESAFREAMSSFQSQCPIIEKTKIIYEKNSTTRVRYKYAPLEDIVKAVQPLLEKNGLSYHVDTQMDSEKIVITLTVNHVFGHSQVTHFTVPIDKKAYMTEPQKWAAAQTFGIRYAFRNGFGILTGEWDNDAGDIDDVKKKKQTTKNKPPAGKETPPVNKKPPGNFKDMENRIKTETDPGKLAAIGNRMNDFKWTENQLKALRTFFSANMKVLLEKTEETQEKTNKTDEEILKQAEAMMRLAKSPAEVGQLYIGTKKTLHSEDSQIKLDIIYDEVSTAIKQKTG